MWIVLSDATSCTVDDSPAIVIIATASVSSRWNLNSSGLYAGFKGAAVAAAATPRKVIIVSAELGMTMATLSVLLTPIDLSCLPIEFT